MAQCFHYPKLQWENEKNEKPELSQDQMDQIMIAEYEERKKAILISNIPAFFGPDPSMY